MQKALAANSPAGSPVKRASTATPLRSTSGAPREPVLADVEKLVSRLSVAKGEIEKEVGEGGAVRTEAQIKAAVSRLTKRTARGGGEGGGGEVVKNGGATFKSQAQETESINRLSGGGGKSKSEGKKKGAAGGGSSSDEDALPGLSSTSTSTSSESNSDEDEVKPRSIPSTPSTNITPVRRPSTGGGRMGRGVSGPPILPKPVWGEETAGGSSILPPMFSPIKKPSSKGNLFKTEKAALTVAVPKSAGKNRAPASAPRGGGRAESFGGKAKKAVLTPATVFVDMPPNVFVGGLGVGVGGKKKGVGGKGKGGGGGGGGGGIGRKGIDEVYETLKKRRYKPVGGGGGHGTPTTTGAGGSNWGNNSRMPDRQPRFGAGVAGSGGSGFKNHVSRLQQKSDNMKRDFLGFGGVTMKSYDSRKYA
jgi:hypothetical protein